MLNFKRITSLAYVSGFITLVLIGLVSCTSSPAPLPTVESTLPKPTNTTTPTLTATNTATASPTVTNTNTPSLTPTITPTPTPIGGKSDGVAYEQFNGEGFDQIFQADLAHSSTNPITLTQLKIEKKLGVSISNYSLTSLSPNGKTAILSISRTPTLTQGYFAATDLSLLVPISYNQYPTGVYIWSPDGLSVMGYCGMSACIISNKNGKAQFRTVYPANPLAWSLDGQSVYYVARDLESYNLTDGSKTQFKLDPIKKLKVTDPEYNNQEIVQALDFSPINREAVFLTSIGDRGGTDDITFNIYKTKEDFSGATLLTSFKHKPQFFWNIKFSPSGKFLWLNTQAYVGTDIIIDLDNGQIPIERVREIKDNVVVSSDSTNNSLQDTFVCGWSADNHFATVGNDKLLLWDPEKSSEPAYSMDFKGNCVYWLLAP